MWYEKNYRRVFMDMHITDTNDTFLTKLDMDDLVSAVKESNATCLVVKGQPHTGLQYWKGSIGRMHRTFQERNIDYVREMIEKCHSNGIAVMTYFSQIHDNVAYDEHPEWRFVDADGNNSRDEYYNGSKRSYVDQRYGTVCPNNPEYREYVCAILAEMTRELMYDGIFLDMPFYTTACHCPSCQKRYMEETGKEIPMKEDWDDPEWIQFMLKRNDWLLEFMNMSTKVIKDIRPEASVEHNMVFIGGGWLESNNEYQAEASDYVGGDYYKGYFQQSFICKYYNSITVNKPFCYITSRCEPNLSFHTVTRTDQDLEIHLINAIVHNGAFSMCDAMNPDGTFRGDLYRGIMKELFNEVAQYEDIVSGDYITDAAVLYATEVKGNENYLDSPMSIGKIFREYNVPYNVVGAKNIPTMKEKLLCIADAFYLSDKNCSDIEKYVSEGGNLFITGKLPNQKLADMCGVKVNQKSVYDCCYVQPCAKYKELFDCFDETNPMFVRAHAWESEVTADDVEVLATLTYPYTSPLDRDFASIHSNPPGICTDIPGAIRRRYGKGTIIWIAAAAEKAFQGYCRQSLYKLMSSLIGPCQYTSNAPEFVDVLGWKKDGASYFSFINEQEITPVYPLHEISITLPYQVKNAALVTPSEDGDIRVTEEEGKTTIVLPKLNVFHIIRVEA